MPIVDVLDEKTSLLRTGPVHSLEKLNLGPGPVSIDDRVVKALASQPPSHLSRSFKNLLEEVIDDMRKVFKTTSGEVAVLTGSGTLAVNAMVYSTVNPRDRVVLIDTGFFSKRLNDALIERGAHVDKLGVDLSSKNYCDEILEFLDSHRHEYDILAMVYTETSIGGTIRCLKRIASAAKQNDMLVIVDGVSAIGGEPFYMDEWGIDAIATCSQKCLEAPPGLSFVALSSDALDKTRSTKDKPPYLDLATYIDVEYSRGRTPFTPASNILLAVRVALEILLREEGLENRWSRYKSLTQYLRENLRKLGLEPVVPDYSASNTVTAVWARNAASIKEVLEERYGVLVATGLGEYANRMLRIGVMGRVGREHIDYLVRALESILDMI